MKESLLDEKIKGYLESVSNFHSVPIIGHKNVDLPIHKLIFLIDIGYDRSIPEIDNAVNNILKYVDENGVYKSNIKLYSKDEYSVYSWALCDAPLLLYALIKLNVDYDTYIKRGLEYLISFYRANGFSCVCSKEFGNFIGPGSKKDMCPYATLLMLKLLSVTNYKDSNLSNSIIGNILYLWENSLNIHPFMFFMGTDFRKIKAPLFWYDIMNVVDILSYFEYAKKDKRFIEMKSIIDSKVIDGYLTPESIYQKCVDFDFGQKKDVSIYLTYRYYMIDKRVNK
jgi:hypothetical protein